MATVRVSDISVSTGPIAFGGTGTLSVTGSAAFTGGASFSGTGNDAISAGALARISQIQIQAVQSAATVRVADITLSTLAANAAQVRIAEIEVFAPSHTWVWNGTTWVDSVAVDPSFSGTGTLITDVPGPVFAQPASYAGTGYLTVVGFADGPAFPHFTGSGSLSVVGVCTFTVQGVTFSGAGVLSLGGTGTVTPVTPVDNGTQFLFSPPIFWMTHFLEGSLRYSIPTCLCVYRKSGVWYATLNPGIGELDGADQVFTTPTVVGSSVATELTAFGQGTVEALGV